MKTFKHWTSFQKRYIPIIASLSATFLIAIILIFTLPSITHNLSNQNNRTKSGWPIRLAAPYIDMSSWVEPTNAYSINGAPNLGKLYDDSGFRYFNLGFINPDQTTPLADDGNIRWGWGGYYSLSKKGGTNSSQYQGIVDSLKNLRAKGGDFAISIGGQLGDAPWSVTQNVNALENFYLDIIGTYELKRLDLDIEMSNQDEDQNIVNAQAIKKVQDKTNIEITLTIPIMPSGWEQKQIKIINAYLDAGVDIACINSMTMCYGTGTFEGEDYGEASVRAITNSIKQLKTIYSNHGYELTDDQAYLKTGATMSIGYESNLYPVFTTEMASTIVEDAKDKNYGLVSMWSMGRDAKLETNSEISTAFEFSKILNNYNNDAN